MFDDFLFITQKKVEKLVRRYYECHFMTRDEVDIPFEGLLPDVHTSYLLSSLMNLPVSYESLDASGPWLVFWILHSLELLAVKISEDLSSKVISYLKSCQSKSGGFGGGPDQLPHLAPTYAAVAALCILKKNEAFEIIDRENLCKFFAKCFQSDGSFTMHDGGETDIRGVYCALSVCRLLNLKFKSEKITSIDRWISECQTYEGGFGATPSCEAHGGYTFCGLASYSMLYDLKNANGENFQKKSFPNIDLPKLMKWVSYKQMSFEGGFQGRTNKLVDACYSFWQGAVFPLLYSLNRKLDSSIANFTFDTNALEQYILICCQKPTGGFIDKPGKNRDLYHTAYALSGLSITKGEMTKNSNDSDDEDFIPLKLTDPVINITPEAIENAVSLKMSHLAASDVKDPYENELFRKLTGPNDVGDDPSVVHHYLKLWHDFKNAQGRKFENFDDEKKRFLIFVDNYHKIQHHNLQYKLGLSTFTMAVNQFADKEPHEICCGGLKPRDTEKKCCGKIYTVLTPKRENAGYDPFILE
uniref:Protein farnesyltransferase subunit beta n=1 Tax=Romanomermis culicivorax TaxID=13658 RepID=A0A915LAL1_ROMCU